MVLNNNKLCVQLIGDKVVIAYNCGNGKEMCYKFALCMANLLYSFQRIGWRDVNYSVSDVDGIFVDLNNNTPVSITLFTDVISSDYIGPIVVYKNNAGNMVNWKYVGGAHYWNEDYNAKIKTAHCNSVQIYADGVELTAAMGKVYCDKVVVNVQNTLFDPSLPPVNGQLTDPLCIETVQYTVQKNSIAVDLTHSFVKYTDLYLGTYYGMQSYYKNEQEIMTPNGQNQNFVTTASVSSFTKQAYPNFNRFVESREDGWCQSAWLRPLGLGNHSMLTSDSNIFTRSGVKSYHTMLFRNTSQNVGQLTPITQGMTYNWKGVYSWFTPMVNTADLLVYQGVVDGQDAIFIDAKRACSVSITTDQYSLGLRFLQQDSGITVTNTTGGLQVVATSAASAIAVQRIKGDINNDGVVDATDASLAVDMVTGVIPVDLIADMNDDGVVDVTDVGLIIDIILGN